MLSKLIIGRRKKKNKKEKDRSNCVNLFEDDVTNGLENLEVLV